MSEVSLSHVPDEEFARRVRESSSGQAERDALRTNDVEVVARASAIFGWGESV